MSRSRPQATPSAPQLVRRLTHLSLTILLIFGVTLLSLFVSPEGFRAGEITILIGFVLLAASVAGSLAATLALPRLTGFLLVGILAGPSVLGVISLEAVTDLRLIDRFALALIAMLAGGELKIQELKPHARTIALVTLCVTVVVWIGFAGAVMAVRPLVPFLAEMSLGASLSLALLLGVWAANSSPDLTVAVIEETRQKGDLAEVVLGITIVKDVLVIVLFTLTMAVVGPLVQAGEAFSAHVVVDLAREVGGAILVGAILGWSFSLYLGKGSAAPRPPLATFLFAFVVVVLADRLHVELLLTGVSAGFVIENLSPAGDRMIRGIESVSVVIFAFFFAIAGASLDLSAIGAFWAAATCLFLARLGLTYLGARLGTRWAGASAAIHRRTWQGLISQGGVTLGLVFLIRDRFPEIGGGVVALGMAIIIGNILSGPIILKRALQEDRRERQRQRRASRSEARVRPS